MVAEPVLFCSHVVDWGGAETVLADLLATIDRDRFAPHLACPGPGPLAARAAGLGVPVHHVPIGGRSPLRKLLGIPRAARALRDLAARLRCRLLVANTMIAGYAAVRAQHGGLACLWHLHIVTRSHFARRHLSRATAVVTPSRAGAAAVDASLLVSGRLHVIPNGVHPEFFARPPATLRSELGLASDTRLIGIVARLDPRKGHEVLLRAFAGLPPSDRPPHLLVVGGEAFSASEARVRGHAQHLEQLALALAVRDRVHLLGHRDDAAGIVGQLDLAAVPSTALESAPRAVAEAQAAGRAVVASDIGGIGELIDDGRDGVLVPPGDAAALANAMHGLLQDDARRAAIGRAARVRAEASYSLATFARRFEAACASALAAR